eukprot:GHRQ01016395.1.p1 GENE.GHRQ01016395.1~~GHRQ01016395.1.p1  ORF type:complete len:129 (-),score=24.13 GHRQ01016395.1:304-690(-)
MSSSCLKLTTAHGPFKWSSWAHLLTPCHALSCVLSPTVFLCLDLATAADIIVLVCCRPCVQALTEFFGTLSAEWALECLKELLLTNMQVWANARVHGVICATQHVAGFMQHKRCLHVLFAFSVASSEV